MSTPETQEARGQVPAGGAVLAAGVIAGGVPPVLIGTQSPGAAADGIAIAARETINALTRAGLKTVREALEERYPGIPVPVDELDQRAQAYREEAARRVRQSVQAALRKPGKREVLRELDRRIADANRTGDGRKLRTLEAARRKAAENPGPRAEAVRKAILAERRYARAHMDAQASRAFGLAEQARLERDSPEGAFWKLGEARHHTLDCCTGDSLIDAAAVVGAARRYYSGPIVEAVTASGRRTSVTPNHPVLTRDGWIPASALKEGDHLVNASLPDAVRRAGDHFEDGPSLASEVFGALAARSDLLVTKLPGRAEDFHGDGGDSNIDVVGTYGSLLKDDVAAITESFGQFRFPVTDVVLERFLHQRLALPVGEWVAPVALGSSDGDARTVQLVVDSASGDPGALVDGEDGLSAYVSLDQPRRSGWDSRAGSRPKLDAVSGQEASNFSPAQSVALAEGVDPGSVEVRLDEIMSVQFREFAGYVYNFETAGHWYSVDSLIVHNCIAMAGRAHPHAVLRKMHPPVHTGCQCRLYSLREAEERGWWHGGPVPSVPEAVAYAQKALALHERDAEAILMLDELHRRGVNLLTEGAGIFDDEWDHGTPDRLKKRLTGLDTGKHVKLPDGSIVRKLGQDEFRVRVSGKVKAGLSLDDAVSDVLDRSARSGKPGSIGPKAFKSFGDFLEREHPRGAGGRFKDKPDLGFQLSINTDPPEPDPVPTPVPSVPKSAPIPSAGEQREANLAYLLKQRGSYPSSEGGERTIGQIGAEKGIVLVPFDTPRPPDNIYTENGLEAIKKGYGIQEVDYPKLVEWMKTLPPSAVMDRAVRYGGMDAIAAKEVLPPGLYDLADKTYTPGERKKTLERVEAAAAPGLLVNPEWVSLAGNPAESSSQMRDLLELAHDRGFDPETETEKETERIRALLDPAKTEVTVRVTSAGLGGILRSKRFKTQHETNKSTAYLGNDTRDQLERRMFGFPADGDPKTRPVYGYVSEPNEPIFREGGFLNQYGSVRLVLKPDVRSRTTVTGDDSLDSTHAGVSPGLVPLPIDEADWRIGRVLNLGKMFTGQKFPDGLNASDSYLEAQVHGGVSLDDVKEIVLGLEPDEKTRKLLEKSGVPWRVQDERERRVTAVWRSRQSTQRNYIKVNEATLKSLDDGTYKQGPYDKKTPEEVRARAEAAVASAKKRLAELEAGEEEYRQLFLAGKLEDPRDTRAMSNPKLRDWVIELGIRKGLGENVEHLWDDAKSEGSTRGPREKEGSGIGHPGFTTSGYQKWAVAVRGVVERMRAEGYDLPDPPGPYVFYVPKDKLGPSPSSLESVPEVYKDVFR